MCILKQIHLVSKSNTYGFFIVLKETKVFHNTTYHRGELSYKHVPYLSFAVRASALKEIKVFYNTTYHGEALSYKQEPT